MFALELDDDTAAVLATSGRIALVVLLAVGFRLLARFAIRGVVRRMQERAESGTSILGAGEGRRRLEARTNALSTVLNSAAGVMVLVVGLLLVLGELRINLAPLLTSAGILAAALAFGAQAIVRDILAGIFILLEDQFGVGDTIDAGPATGVVERVTLRSTRIRDLAGTVWHIPNGTITRVGNKSQNWARAVVEVVVAHHADVRLARELMREAAEALAADPEWSTISSAAAVDEQGISALTPAGITLRVVVEVEPASQWRIERELRLRIKEAFDRAGVPFEVHQS